MSHPRWQISRTDPSRSNRTSQRSDFVSVVGSAQVLGAVVEAFAFGQFRGTESHQGLWIGLCAVDGVDGTGVTMQVESDCILQRESQPSSQPSEKTLSETYFYSFFLPCKWNSSCLSLPICQLEPPRMESSNALRYAGTQSEPWTGVVVFDLAWPFHPFEDGLPFFNVFHATLIGPRNVVLIEHMVIRRPERRIALLCTVVGRVLHCTLQGFDVVKPFSPASDASLDQVSSMSSSQRPKIIRGCRQGTSLIHSSKGHDAAQCSEQP
ncbi:hypothetical protein BKA80DRAFT_262338 [Phyllosticta citrichinensis]